MLNKQTRNKKYSPSKGARGCKKNFPILNPCYQRVKKNNKKNTKKRLEKACGYGKDFYFCTRIRAEVHTQTED